VATVVDPAVRDAGPLEQRRLARSGAGVDIVVGVAGSGKTFALGAAHDAWVSSDHRVIGAALSARAAAELQDGSGIPSTTLARLLADLDRPDADGLPQRCVLVVDEAAMVGTRHLARLLDHAQAAGAKVVLVGDHHQLAEIDAGGEGTMATGGAVRSAPRAADPDTCRGAALMSR
jgi:ATP-dependent exoDNAse (exonuclease V) alpha subunit